MGPKSDPKEQQATRLKSLNKFNPPQQGRRELHLGKAEREEERATLTTAQRTSNNPWKTLRVLRHFPSRPVSACSRKS